ncbi:MAG: hypothetical protein LBB45_06170 [Methanobrevibacter sp.]|jgi:hypothetical protein|nr:hypothetical protein [Candidatus Methanovirga basalitermitum]
MKPVILKAKDEKEITKLARHILKKGFKEVSKDENHIILKKRNFGSMITHVCFLLLILFGSISFFQDIPIFNFIKKYNINFIDYVLQYFLCSCYVVYIVFNLFMKTKVVLITTETKDADGNPIEFNMINDLDI